MSNVVDLLERMGQSSRLQALSSEQLAQELLDAAQRQQEKVQLLRSAWQANIASELGLALQAGDPCAVCGSVEHPKPARPAADHVSQAQVSRAESELSRLTQDVEQRRVSATIRTAARCTHPTS